MLRTATTTTPSAITISEWKPLHRATLRGFLTVHLPSGMNLHEVSVHTRDGVWWVMPASKAMLSKDGTALRDENNKIRYTQIISFTSRATRDRFIEEVLAALRQAQPQVFALESAI